MPDILNVRSATHQHAVPGEYHFLRERRGESAVQIDHHFRDPLLCRRDPPIVCGESKLSLDGRLHTGAIENLALDFGCSHRLRAHRLDRELIALLLAQVLHRAQKNTSPNEELLLR